MKAKDALIMNTARAILDFVTEAEHEHSQRWQAQAHLRKLRAGGFKGRVSIEKDKDKGIYFLRQQPGELAKPGENALTPYDRQIRRMVKFGTEDLHGALADVIYSDKRARRDFEGDGHDASWEDASADLATNYLQIHGLLRRRRIGENEVGYTIPGPRAYIGNRGPEFTKTWNAFAKRVSQEMRKFKGRWNGYGSYAFPSQALMDQALPVMDALKAEWEKTLSDNPETPVDIGSSVASSFFRHNSKSGNPNSQ